MKNHVLTLALIPLLLSFTLYTADGLRVKPAVSVWQNQNFPYAFKLYPNQSTIFYGYEFTYNYYPNAVLPYKIKWKKLGTMQQTAYEWGNIPTTMLHWLPSSTDPCRFSFMIAEDPAFTGSGAPPIYFHNITFFGCSGPEYDLSISANVDQITLQNVGEEATLTFTIENTGTETLTDVQYRLQFSPQGFMLVDEESDPTQGVIASIAPGGSTTISYVLKAITSTEMFTSLSLNVTYTAYTSYINIPVGTKTVTSKVLGPASKSKTVYVSIGKPPEPYELPKIEISISPLPQVKPGELITVTVNFRNNGNGSAYDTRIYAEANPPELKFIYGGSEYTALGYAKELYIFDQTTYEEEGVRLFPMAASVPWSFQVKAPQRIEGSSKTYTIIVRAEYYNNKGHFFQEERNVTLTVVKPGKPSLTIHKYISASMVSIGSQLTLTIEVENAGEGPAFNVEITDSFPPQFTLISGQVSKTVNELPKGEKISYSYTIQAMNEFSGSFPVAQVSYEDSEGLSNVVKSNAVSVKVVMASVSISRTESPEEIEIDQIFDVTYTIVNEGTGTARDINVTINISRGLEIFDIDGPAEEFVGKRIGIFLDRLEPNQIVKVTLSLRGLLPGPQVVNITSMEYKSPDEALTFKIKGENLDFNVIVKTPLLVRSMLILVVGLLVVIVEYAVLAATFKLSASKARRKRFKLG